MADEVKQAQAPPFPLICRQKGPYKFKEEHVQVIPPDDEVLAQIEKEFALEPLDFEKPVELDMDGTIEARNEFIKQAEVPFILTEEGKVVWERKLNLYYLLNESNLLRSIYAKKIEDYKGDHRAAIANLKFTFTVDVDPHNMNNNNNENEGMTVAVMEDLIMYWRIHAGIHPSKGDNIDARNKHGWTPGDSGFKSMHYADTPCKIDRTFIDGNPTNTIMVEGKEEPWIGIRSYGETTGRLYRLLAAADYLGMKPLKHLCILACRMNLRKKGLDDEETTAFLMDMLYVYQEGDNTLEVDDDNDSDVQEGIGSDDENTNIQDSLKAFARTQGAQ
jgi:hypothetical protein